MPRNISTPMLTALSQTILRPALFVSATFASETVYMWSGSGNTTWNSQTWTGTGALLGITTPEDGSTVEARGISITLSGIDPVVLPEMLTDYKLGAPAAVYLGLYDATNTLISSPATSWKGRMDQPTIDVDTDSAVITINCESRLIDMNVASDRRYTLEDQNRDWPGDLGFSFVNAIQQQTLFWGKYPVGNNL